MEFEVIAQGPNGQFVLLVRRPSEHSDLPLVVGPASLRTASGEALDEEVVIGDELMGLPEEVRQKIEDQFRLVARRAARHFASTEGDEDAVSGGLIHDIDDTVNGTAAGYRWRTTTRKVRGRGPGAPEKKYGADLGVEIEVVDHGVRRLKTLLVQSKKRWMDKDAKLGEQAAKLGKLPGDGAVFDFREGHYRGCRASVAAKADGDARRVPADEFRDIGDLFADFVKCRIGSTRVIYDQENEQLVVFEDDAIRDVDLDVGYLTHTVVRRETPSERANRERRRREKRMKAKRRKKAK